MRRFLFVLAALLCVALGIFTVLDRQKSDRRAPEITVVGGPESRPDLTEEELLKYASAADNVDGDVTSSVVVESYTFNEQTGTGIVVYAVKDSHNNVGKARYVLDPPAGYEPGSFSETETESETEKQTETETESKSEEAQTETEVAVQEQETETEETEVQEETNPGAPTLTLTRHGVTIHIGDEFNPVDYVDQIEDDYDNLYELWQHIQVDGDYSTSEPGTYRLIYSVTDNSGNRSNRPILTLKVED